MSVAKTASSITMKVLLFAQLKDHFGSDGLAASLPSGSTGVELMEWLSQRNPKVKDLLGVSCLAVNYEYVSSDHVLQDGDEVVVIPPVSGG